MRIWDPIGRWLERRPAGLLFVLALLGVAVVGLCDHVTGPELAFSIFYLAPVALCARYATRGAAYAIALLSSATWLIADLSSGHVYTHEAIPYWNSLVRLGFFLIVAYLVHALRLRYELEKARAETDALTGLLISRAYYERATAEIERSRRYRHPFTLVYLDLDNFKAVNDGKGHQEGDRVLKAVAESLRANTRQSDLVARLGGDEFSVLLAEAGAADARQALAKLQAKLLEEMQRHGWPVTFSIGAVAYAQAPDNMIEVVKRADDLMYAVKHAGKNSFKLVDWPNGPSDDAMGPA